MGGQVAGIGGEIQIVAWPCVLARRGAATSPDLSPAWGARAGPPPILKVHQQPVQGPAGDEGRHSRHPSAGKATAKRARASPARSLVPVGTHAQ